MIFTISLECTIVVYPPIHYCTRLCSVWNVTKDTTMVAEDENLQVKYLSQDPLWYTPEWNFAMSSCTIESIWQLICKYN